VFKRETLKPRGAQKAACGETRGEGIHAKAARFPDLTGGLVRPKRRIMQMPFELAQFQQVLFNRLQDSIVAEQALSAWRSSLGAFAMWGALPIVGLILLVLGVILFYQPRVTRGSLWVPAFGIFGGHPKLYMHSRPPSLAGMFLRSLHRAKSR
jgi:hypothetical protein